jgi:signal recognition particle subunit SRP54
VQDVNRLLKQFEESRKMMKQLADMSRKGKKGKKGGFPLNFPF